MTKQQTGDQGRTGTWRRSRTEPDYKTSRPVDHGNGRRSAITSTDDQEAWYDPDARQR